MRCATWPSNGPNHLGLCALQVITARLDRLGAISSSVFSFGSRLSSLPANELSDPENYCVVAIAELSTAVLADVTSHFICQPSSTKSRKQAPAQVVGACLTSTEALKATFASKNLEKLTTKRCLVLALHREDGAAAAAGSSCFDLLDEYLQATKLADVLHKSSTASIGTSCSTLADMCVMLEPMNADGKASLDVFNTELSFFVGGQRNLSLSSKSALPSSAVDSQIMTGIETSVSVMKADPVSLMPSHLRMVLNRVEAEGLDLVGFRFVHPSATQTTAIRNCCTYCPPTKHACLCIAVRGWNAVERWKLAVGPEDPTIAKQVHFDDDLSKKAAAERERERGLRV